MKNLLLILFISFLFLSSCSNDEKSTEKENSNRVNMLLPSSVPVKQLFFFDTAGIPFWQQNLKAANLIEKVFNKALNSEVAVYNSFSPFFSDADKYTKEDIIKQMGATTEPLSLSEIKAIYFEEEWSLDTTDPILFNKNIISWSPVRYYSKNPGDTIIEKKLVFKLKKGNETELLAKNVINEFNLEDTINPEFTSNINIQRLSELLIDKALSGKTPVYKPTDISVQLTKEEILQSMGKITDTIYVDNPETGEIDTTVIQNDPFYYQITSIIFIEDWYYDPATFSIKKEITGIGPVRHYTKGDQEIKSVVFLMYPGNKKTPIFN